MFLKAGNAQDYETQEKAVSKITKKSCIIDNKLTGPRKPPINFKQWQN
jgi:hypothetical protein